MFNDQPCSFVAVSKSSNLTIPRVKFDIGDRVYWFRVPTQDFGDVVDYLYGTEGTVQALGWHYLIQLDPRSPSFAHCKFDWGFEADLAILDSENDGDALESNPD